MNQLNYHRNIQRITLNRSKLTCSCSCCCCVSASRASAASAGSAAADTLLVSFCKLRSLSEATSAPPDESERNKKTEKRGILLLGAHSTGLPAGSLYVLLVLLPCVHDAFMQSSRSSTHAHRYGDMTRGMLACTVQWSIITRLVCTHCSR